MRHDPHGYGLEVGDRVRVLVGSHADNTGRIVVRKHVEAFKRFGVVYEVEFDFAPNGRGYRVQYQPHHLERIDP